MSIRPAHYGGEENPFKAIKIIEHYNLNFSIGSAIKYILRAGKKDNIIQDYQKAITYLEFEVKRLSKPDLKIIIITGPAASGKTELAKQLTKGGKAKWIFSPDDILDLEHDFLIFDGGSDCFVMNLINQISLRKETIIICTQNTDLKIEGAVYHKM